MCTKGRVLTSCWASPPRWAPYWQLSSPDLGGVRTVRGARRLTSAGVFLLEVARNMTGVFSHPTFNIC